MRSTRPRDFARSVDIGARELKGVPGEWRLYAVDAIEAPVSRQLIVDEREKRFSFT